MERDEIVREDFPTARRGWDPDAVRAHLNSLAERLPTETVSLGDAAAERVGAIVGAAEATAAEIEAEARGQAEAIAAAARDEAAEIVERARSEAQGRLDQAQQAVESLLGQAEALRSRVASQPATPATKPEPAPDRRAGDVAEQTARPAAEPKPAPEPAPADGSAGGSDTPAVDLAGARLVAMNLALEGADRELISARLESEFGAVDELESMLDDVLARAGRS